MHLMTHRTLFHPTSRETTMQLFRLLIAAACALGTLPALAQTTVKDPWVRGTFTFTISGITLSGYTYAPTRNVETGDSIATP